MRRILSTLLLMSFFGFSLLAADAPIPILGNIKLSNSSYRENEEQARKQKESIITDSLLNSIEIDSLTGSIYRAFPPRLESTRIIGGLGDAQYTEIEIPEPSYQQLAGVICMTDSGANIIYPKPLPIEIRDPIPDWFKKSLRFQNQLHEASAKMLINNPEMIEYADWNLPVPPRIPREDYSFKAFLKRMNLSEISPDETVLPEVVLPRRNWLHYFNVALQFSQAYVSPNWYQGGNSYLAGLFNFTWNVELNTVFHPKLLFQSSLEYKLAVNSNPKGSLHKYNTSQDLFQYNLKTGFKAFNHWFYSLNLLFTTQLFNSYPDDSLQRESTLLSPGTLNIGLGMTYTLEKKGATLTATISPLAYNLKTCIANDIDHEQFNIKPNRKTVSEIGSSAEVNLTWKFNDNISWKSRLFLFTDYDYFLADWENTFNFQLNKFLSTQIYLHPRFDSSSVSTPKWHRFMLREVLSFGISYTFSTPK